MTVAFDADDVVTDTGLFALRQLDLELGVLAEAAERLPEPGQSVAVGQGDRLVLPGNESLANAA